MKLFDRKKGLIQQNTNERLLNAFKRGVKKSAWTAFFHYRGCARLLHKSYFCPDKLGHPDIRILLDRGKIIAARNQVDALLPIWEEKLHLIGKGRDSENPLIALVVPDGQSVRTFLLTDVWGLLNTWTDIVVIAPAEGIESLYDIPGIKRERILPMPDLKRLSIDILLRFVHYRNSSGLTHQIFAKNIDTSMRKKEGISMKIRRIWELSSLFSSEKSYLGLYEFAMMVYGALYPMKKICEMIRRLSPHVVFNTNAISYNARLWTRAAALEGIPTAAFVISWDNLSSKWLVDEFADLCLLWSEEMAEDFKTSFPIFGSKKIMITGSPQFEPIIRKSLGISRKAFFRKYRLRDGVPLILYTTGSKTTFPAEPEFLIRMLSIWMDKYYDRMQFMIRMHPKDMLSRYEAVKSAFPEVPFTLAGENLQSGERWLPTADDIGLLVDQINYCDIILNVASTMTIEGFAVDKPSVNIGFDLGKINSIHYPLKDYYNSKHYSDVITTGAAKLAINYEDVFKNILHYLEDLSSDRDARKRIFLKKCNYPFDSSVRIDNALRNFIDRIR
jgi:hypothetical protein